MARRPRLSGTPRSTPEGDAPLAGATSPEGVDPRVLATVLEATKAGPRLDPEELAGTTEFLDLLDDLEPIERARLGFRFTVYAAEGPRQFLSNSEWGESVPTEAAIAEVYGPGTYRVKVARRRRGQGGGWSTEIVVRIARPRSPETPAPAPLSSDGRAWELVSQLIGARAEAVADAPTLPNGAIVLDENGLKELSRQIEAAAKAKDSSLLPAWLQPLAEKFLGELLAGGATVAPAAPGASGGGASS